MTDPLKTAWAGPYVGRSLPRFEDWRFVRGEGRYTDDITLEGQVHVVFVRSPHAHARLLGIVADAARKQPGVLAVLTGADYVADGLAPIAQRPVPSDAIDHRQPAFSEANATRIVDTPFWPLATDMVRHVGEPVAVVVAESGAAAREAAERIEVEYEVLPPRTSAPSADTIVLDAQFGDRDAVQAADASSDIAVEATFRNQRIATAQMEPRSAIGAYDPKIESYTLIAGSQGAHTQAQALATALKTARDKVHVTCPDTGGGFGSRTHLNPEPVVLAWAARKVGRPVKWTSERTEAFQTDYQGRDIVARTRLRLSADGTILSLAVELVANVGAHTVSYVPLNNGYRIATNVYHVPLAHAHVVGTLSNTVPTGPYRGAGRPEAIFAIERLLDIAARRLNIDRIEIRRRNLIKHAQLPYRTAFGFTYDSGDFLANMERALEIADWNGFPARRDEAGKRGRLRGIGIANYIESPVGFPHERIEVSISADAVTLLAGTQSTGQGHETTFAQVMADQLGVTPEAIRFVGGDTAKVKSGGGTHSDRSMRLAGTLMVEAAAALIGKAKPVAAHLLGVDEAAVRFEEGAFRAQGSNRQLSVFDIARAIEQDSSLPASLRTPLAAEATFTGRIAAHPTGAAVCEVEIDLETGAPEIVRYASVDDAGQPVNPMILHGQVHGGIAQGIGQALGEHVIYDDSGQLLTASFADYPLPRAGMLPAFEVELAEDPTPGNPLRIKGGGESGITPSPAAVMNAIVDALSAYGIEHLDMPATPCRIWTAIQQATQKTG